MSNRPRLRNKQRRHTSLTAPRPGYPDVLLVVGNGLSLDLAASTHPALSEWDTRTPLTWPAKAPPDSGPNLPPNSTLLDVLPRARQAIDNAKTTLPLDSSHFTILSKAIELSYSSAEAEDDFSAEAVRIELRHFIAHSYSSYQEQADKTDKRNWLLGNRLKEIAASKRLLGAISFNYDTNLEGLLLEADVPLLHLGTGFPFPGAVGISKPHGSIDYTPDARVFSLPRTVLEYPRTFWASQTDCPIQLLSRDQLQNTRVTVDLVLPAEETKIAELQWVKAGTEWLRIIGPHVRTIIVIGISYMDVDRRELDAIFTGINPSAQPVLVDPYPNPDLVRKLRQVFGVEPRRGIDLNKPFSL